MKTFEQYLQDKHAEQYEGLDDEMFDDFNEWVRELESYEIIAHAEKWAKGKGETLRNVYICIQKRGEKEG